MFADVISSPVYLRGKIDRLSEKLVVYGWIAHTLSNNFLSNKLL